MIEFVAQGPYGHIMLACLCGRPVSLSFGGVDSHDCPCGRVVSYDPEDGIEVKAPPGYRPPLWIVGEGDPVPYDGPVLGFEEDSE